MPNSKKIKGALLDFAFGVIIAILGVILAEHLFRLFGLKVSMQQLINYVPILTFAVIIFALVVFARKGKLR